MSSPAIMNRFFEGLANRLTSGYPSSSFQKTAPSRTGANREWLVGEFLRDILPVSVQVRHGAVIVDTFGKQSCDVDVVALQPWASPVWPYANGIVPVEGVMCAILVESVWRGSNNNFWKQVVSLATLLKSIDEPSGYVMKRRRDFHVVRGIWCWKGTLKSIVEHVERKAGSLRRAVLDHSRKAIVKGWIGPQPNEPHDPGRKKLEKKNCATYHADNDGGVPSWIYVHGPTRDKRFLMLKVEKRDVLRKGKWQMTNEKIPEGEIPKRPRPNKFVLRDSKHRRWFYTVYKYNAEKRVDPLRILTCKLCEHFTAFRFERTRYEAYLEGGE